MTVRTAALGMLLAACSGGSAPEPAPITGILLVTLDTTRADRIGAYGYASARTPVLDRLAAEGVVFESAFAPTPITLPSHTSLLTGVYPTVHGVRDNGLFRLRDEAVLVSEVLRERAWRTAASVGAHVLDPRFGLDQGFERYTSVTLGRELAFGVADRPADEVVGDAIDWLHGVGPDERFFLWVHFYDPHGPYRHGDPKRGLASGYDAEIAFCDAQLGRLLRFLETRDRVRELLVVVTADHGEAFGEHGEFSHGALLYQPTMRVPLLFSGSPVAEVAGTRDPRPVSNAQIAPTLLALLGVPPESMPASRLPPLLGPGGADEGSEAAPVYLETTLPYYSFGWRALRGLAAGPYKLIEGRHRELYALDDDPGEARDLAASRPQQLQGMQAQLESVLRMHLPLGWADDRNIGTNEQALLESLGYAVGGGDGDLFDPTLPDPVERVGDTALYQEVNVLLARYQATLGETPIAAWQSAARDARARELLAEARERLLQIRENNASDRRLPHMLGIVERNLGNLEVALPLLERAAALHPALARNHFELAIAHAQAGHLDAAVARATDAVRIERGHGGYYEAVIHWSTRAGEYGLAYGWLQALSEVVEPGSEQALRVADALIQAEAEMRALGQRPRPPDLRTASDPQAGRLEESPSALRADGSEDRRAQQNAR